MGCYVASCSMLKSKQLRLEMSLYIVLLTVVSGWLHLVAFSHFHEPSPLQHTVDARRTQTLAAARTNKTTVRKTSSDLVLLTYSSTPVNQSLLWGSLHEHIHDADTNTNTKIIHIGLGVSLFDDATHTSGRGWMFRLRQLVHTISLEYQARGGQDYLVLVVDASDGYIGKRLTNNTLELVKEHFIHDFDNHSIVFSAQIYCCNPPNMKQVGRAGWDEYYNSMGGPETIYKYLNAGLFMGYASTILDMSNEMKIFDTLYQPQSALDRLLETKGASNVHMFDVDADDDEWQMSIWFIKEQRKASPRAVLDVHQHLFSNTGTRRAYHHGDKYTAFSRKTFFDGIGTLPNTFNKTSLEEIRLCPFAFDPVVQTWTHTITKSHPLVFHFGGNEWLCACEMMKADDFDQPSKFAFYCSKGYPFWRDRVNECVRKASTDSHPNRLTRC
jgi:hypothetical protein